MQNRTSMAAHAYPGLRVAPSLATNRTHRRCGGASTRTPPLTCLAAAPSEPSSQDFDNAGTSRRRAALARLAVAAGFVLSDGLPLRAWAEVEQGPCVYLDVKLEGKPLGRIVVQLFPDVAVGSARFRDLAVGKEGVGYRLSRFDGIFPTYIRCEGASSLSYSATGESTIAGGASTELVEGELAAQARSHDRAGLVSLVVRDSMDRPTTEKLIARNGKLETILLESGQAANGTTFVITRAPDAQLDSTNLIVGRVVQGSEVVDAIAALPFAKPRESFYDGPFYSAALAMGDKRATTAAKGFNRPLKRVVVSGTGVLQS